MKGNKTIGQLLIDCIEAVFALVGVVIGQLGVIVVADGGAVMTLINIVGAWWVSWMVAWLTIGRGGDLEGKRKNWKRRAAFAGLVGFSGLVVVAAIPQIAARFVGGLF